MHKKYDRLTFVHDGPIFFDKDGKYYEYSYHNLKERYGYLAKNITFLIRTSPISSDTTYTEVPDEIKIKSVPNLNSPKAFFCERKKVEKIVDEEIKNTDMLIIRGGSYASIAIKYATKYQKPYIYECVGCSWDGYWNHSLVGKIVAPYAFLRDRFLINKASYVYYVTNKFLQKRYPTKGIAVGCSDVVIDNINDEVLDKRYEIIEKMNSKDAIRIGTAAAIDVRYKGQEYVIKAVKELKECGYNVEYYLAGGNRKKSDYLQNLTLKLGIVDNVHFLGSLSANEMQDFYDSLDIYIQPSLQEGMPRSVIEAMSRGCPVLGAKTGGIPELISKEYVFNRKDFTEIKNAILMMLNSDMKKVAWQNMNVAKGFEAANLERKRNSFYALFLKNNN